MRLSDRPVQKMNEEEYGREELHFVPTETGARAFFQTACAGKLLIVSDGESYKRLSRFAVSVNALALIYDGDALPLFSMPDDVGGVLAAGGEDVLLAARYFATVRRLPCAVFPSSGTLFGAFEKEGTLTLCGERKPLPLAPSEVYFDLKNGFSLSEAYAQVYLTKLACFEEQTLAYFAHETPPQRAIFSVDPCPDQARLVALNARMRCEERDGRTVGEGRTLAKCYESGGNKRPVFRAFTELMALYYSFFQYGAPRRYFVSDYRARAKMAGISYSQQKIPTLGEYAARAFTLEKIRSERLSVLTAILNGWKNSPFYIKQAASLLNLDNLKYLPERGGGLSVIIRDFGLLG